MTIVVLVGGGHCAGKQTCAELIVERLRERMVRSITATLYPLDQFLVAASASAVPEPSVGRPLRFDFHKLRQSLDAEMHKGTDLVVVHGLYALYNKAIRDVLSVQIFVDSDPDTRLTRWIQRDVLENKSRLLEDVLDEYLNNSRPQFNEFIFPTKEFADVVLPRGPEPVGVGLVVDGLEPMLRKEHERFGVLREEWIQPPDLAVAQGGAGWDKVGAEAAGYLRILFRKESFDEQRERFYDIA